MQHHPVPLKATLDSLPPLWPQDVLPQIRTILTETPSMVFVLDDDPTGAQTVQDASFLTEWTRDMLLSEYHQPEKATFLLTNTRAKTEAEAVEINTTLGREFDQLANYLKIPISIISRSDSTLRGHFPAELHALAKGMGNSHDGIVFIPFFIQGGRYTIDDIQYVAGEGMLAPVGQTPFARDSAFGYESSNLRDWIEEKTFGKVLAKDVLSVSIDDIRIGGPDVVAEKLKDMKSSDICIINAADMRDLDVVALAMLTLQNIYGKNYLIRSSASFVRSRLGQEERPILTKKEMGYTRKGGALILVGSHVPGSTSQLESLLNLPNVYGLELDVHKVLQHDKEQIISITEQTDRLLAESKDIVIYTSREVVTGSSPDEYLEIGTTITEAITEVVSDITITPRYIISKGGMTSSNIIVNALKIKRATVLGQIASGVLVLQLGLESKYPGSKLILWPGNVGGPTAISDVVLRMRT
ncbi:MAG: four-carbon acid sugar kinase family protein [SAR202 cluster bacterium]|jgi:uncharacterized protein YgbK (DUF1537 family)|nr:four-carbon acid sugar kinase family protein [SAR202 cluster bacterium]HJO60965.1 four-carbon acid sugar kinase family protein [SAR202 cluster bacterium]|tara:strand:- start:27041 stop:28450 length:1410 start_codon:yes stop_codon:yes gene_type:complete